MANSLYQKYRPQKFSDLFGQIHIRAAIENQISLGKLSHAYLFCGPRAVGKTTIARLLAKAVNCENRKEGEVEPCNECSSCKEIKIGNALDIIEIDAASHTGVDNVRENIIASTRVAPVNKKFKVFIIDEVHMLSISAFNALLKTLEEPPGNVIFILATTEIHKVPATIISRCQRYDFKKIGNKEIIDKLSFIASQEGREVDLDVLKNIAAQSEGCLRDAESLLGQILFLDEKKITSDKADLVIPKSDFNIVMKFISHLLANDLEKSFYLINKTSQDGIDLRQFARDMASLLRKIILVKVGGSLDYFGLEFGDEMEREILKIAEGYDLDRFVKAVELFLKVEEELKKTPIITLPFEIAIIKFIEKEENKKTNIVIERKIETEESEEKTNNATDFNKKSEEVKTEEIILEKNEVQKIENNSKEEGVITVEEIQKRWADVLEGIKKYNHTFSFILKVAKPHSVEGKILKIAHKYKFNLERTQDIKNKQNLEIVLKDIFNVSLIVDGIVDESLEIANNEPKEERPREDTSDNQEIGQEPNLLQDVLTEFGGEIV